MKSTEGGSGDDCNMLGNLDGTDEACEDDDEYDLINSGNVSKFLRNYRSIIDKSS